MNFVNGYSDCIFRSYTPEGALISTYAFSFVNQGLYEYDEDKYIEHEIIDGSIEQEFFYLRKVFEPDWNQLIYKSDLLMVQSLHNDERAGAIITLQPNSDENRRVFKVVSVKEQRKLSRHKGKADSLGNMYGPTRWKTSEPLSGGDWTDPDLNIICEEMENLVVI